MNLEDYPYIDVVFIKEDGLNVKSGAFFGSSCRRAELSTNLINNYLKTKNLTSLQYDYEEDADNEMKISFFMTTLHKCFEHTGVEIEWLQLNIEA